jgi:hypothetical protein
VTRDGFDFFACYLPDYDFASHASGPDGAVDALGRSDRAIGALIEAAGGPDEFLERYSLIVCSDHGQTAVGEVARLEDAFRDVAGVLVTASNRAGMLYRLPGCDREAAELAAILDGDPAIDVALYLDGEEAVARRDGAELRFAAGPDGWRARGDTRVLDHPGGLERAWAALRNPNAGDVLVSAAAGYEFADLGGRHHAGGGSHGSLCVGDSEVPMLTVGLEPPPVSITGVAPLLLDHFGLERPVYARAA